MKYLTYDQYINLGGNLDPATFSDYEFEAESLIDWYTFNRLKKLEEYPEELQRCVLRLISLAKMQADLLSGATGKYSASTSATGQAAIASQSNDGVSISYNMLSASEVYAALAAKGAGSTVERTIRQYLGSMTDAKGRNLFYRGLYEDE